MVVVQHAGTDGAVSGASSGCPLIANTFDALNVHIVIEVLVWDLQTLLFEFFTGTTFTETV